MVIENITKIIFYLQKRTYTISEDEIDYIPHTIFEEIIDSLFFEIFFKKEFKTTGIEIFKYAENEFKNLVDILNEDSDKNIKSIFERLSEKKNPLRNQIKLMKIELKQLLNPILSV